MVMLWLLLTGALLSSSRAQRNAEAEAMCQPFLTSNISSPLLPDLRRNLKIDEDGEYFCELVLQDVNLPAQVRVTIHEGLSYLAIRHVQMGLERHRDAYRHLKLLAQIVPSNFNFQHRAGIWSLDPMISRPEEGVDYFHQALYGEAKEDDSVNEDTRIEARKNLAIALGSVGRFQEALIEYSVVLERYPLDFGVADLLKECLDEARPIEPDFAERIQSLLQPSSDYYKLISSLVDNQYKREWKSWVPREYDAVPSSEDFHRHLINREPFIIRSGVSLFPWRTDNWTDVSYLKAMAGEESVLVERRAGGAKYAPFGFSAGVYRVKTSFQEFLAETIDGISHPNDYLNVQHGFFRDGMWSSPLNRLKEDIPVPTLLKNIETNITSINMWMSNAKNSPVRTRMHMDPMDSLFALVSGEKIIKMFAPGQKQSLQTISPTFGVSSDGFSFQYNSPANLPTLGEMQGAEVAKGHYHYSRVDVSTEAGGIDVTLRAGDVIYIPAGWFHEVTTSPGAPSIAINSWWLPKNWQSTVSLEGQMKSILFDNMKSRSQQSEL